MIENERGVIGQPDHLWPGKTLLTLAFSKRIEDLDARPLKILHVSGSHRQVVAAREFGNGARVPVTWLVAANDSYFSPAFSRQLADAFRAGGGKVDFHVLPASGGEGHWLAETESGVRLAASGLDRALRGGRPAAAARQ